MSKNQAVSRHHQVRLRCQAHTWRNSGKDLSKEINSGIPVAVPLRLPTMQEQIDKFTRIGNLRREMYYDNLPDDDFEEHLDDLSEDGYSPHEIAEIKSRRVVRVKKVADKDQPKPQKVEAETKNKSKEKQPDKDVKEPELFDE